MHKIDDNMASRLKQAAIKHDHMTSDVKSFYIDGIDNIDNPIRPGSELT